MMLHDVLRLAVLACALSVATVAPASESDSADYRELVGKDLGLRTHPDNDAKYVVAGLRSGDRVRVLGCEKHHGNGWCRVVHGNSIGWIGEQRLRATSGGAQQGADGWEITDAGKGVPLRTKPDKDARVILQGLRNGDEVRMLGCEKHHGNNWCRVEFEGYIGWIGRSRLRQH